MKLLSPLAIALGIGITAKASAASETKLYPDPSSSPISGASMWVSTATILTLSGTTVSFDTGGTTLPLVVVTDTRLPSATESYLNGTATSLIKSTETQTIQSSKTVATSTTSTTAEPTGSSPSLGAVVTSAARSDGHKTEARNGVWMMLAVGGAIAVCQFVTIGQLMFVRAWVPETVC